MFSTGLTTCPIPLPTLRAKLNNGKEPKQECPEGRPRLGWVKIFTVIIDFGIECGTPFLVNKTSKKNN